MIPRLRSRLIAPLFSVFLSTDLLPTAGQNVRDMKLVLETPELVLILENRGTDDDSDPTLGCTVVWRLSPEITVYMPTPESAQKLRCLEARSVPEGKSSGMAEINIRAKWERNRNYFFLRNTGALGVSLDIAVRQRGTVIFKKRYKPEWPTTISRPKDPAQKVIDWFISDLRKALGLPSRDALGRPIIL